MWNVYTNIQIKFKTFYCTTWLTNVFYNNKIIGFIKLRLKNNKLKLQYQG